MSWSDILTVYILLFTGVRSLLCLSVVAPLSFIEFVVCRVWGGVDAEVLRAKLDVIPAFVGPRGCQGSCTEDSQNCWAPGIVPSDALASERP